MMAARHDTTIDALMRRGVDHAFAEYGVNLGAADAPVPAGRPDTSVERLGRQNV